MVSSLLKEMKGRKTHIAIVVEKVSKNRPEKIRIERIKR